MYYSILLHKISPKGIIIFILGLLFYFPDANSLTVLKDDSKFPPDIVSHSEYFTNKYGFRMQYKYDKHYFPPYFYKNPYNTTVVGISPDDLNFMIPLIEQVFSLYGNAIYDKIDAVYMAESINVYGQDFGIFSFGRSLYIPVLSNTKRPSATEITEKMHKEIHAILYDYYPSIIAQIEWKTADVFNARFKKDSLESISIQSLNSLGFVNNESFESTKNDFINIGLWYHSKRNDLGPLESEYHLIKEKVDKYRLFIELLGPNINCGSFDQAVQKFYGEYGILINYCYDINNFPRLWTNSGKVIAEQISGKDKNLIIDVLGRVFVGFDSFSIASVLKNIYLVENLKRDNRFVNSLNYNNRLFLSINEDAIDSKNIEDSIANAVALELAWIFRRNYGFLFPEKKWDEIQQYEFFEGGDSLEKLKHYDIINYIKWMILRKSHYSHLVPIEKIDSEKGNIILGFFDSIKYWLDSTNPDEDELILASEKLKNKYGVAIWWDVQTPNEVFKFPSLLYIEEELCLRQTARTIDVIENFLKKYPAGFIQNELKNIVLTLSMYNVNSSGDIAGTYEETSKTIFLSNAGDDGLSLEGVLHHEMGHLILDSNEMMFDTEKWISHNHPDFDYIHTGFGSVNSLFESNAYYLEKGFLNKYSTRFLGEDFAEFTKMYFTNYEKLIQITETYPRIKAKYEVFEEFIEKVVLNNK